MYGSHRAPTASARTILKLSVSGAALGAGLLLIGTTGAMAQTSLPDAAQVSAGSKVPDPAASSSTAANPNEAGGAEDRKAANAAQTGDITPATNEAVAQAAGAAATDAGASPEQADIVVTGFRRSLENAVAEKKNRDQIVESVSAEDIGKLPDASIAESIARLPGLTSQRIQGRSNSISIRGFAPDFSTTLLNGREQTSTGDNRAVEYDQYPAEVVNQVVVYKTGTASVIGQGLSGTVDLRTIRPLEFGRRVISIGARGVDADIGKLNADSKQYGYRVNGTYVDQFLDKRLGVALAASYTDEPYQTQEFNAWGYGAAGPSNAALIGGSKSYITSNRLRRLGLTGTVEFRPVENFTTTIDGFYSDFQDHAIKRGIELPLGFDGQNGLGVTDPANTGARFNPATGQIANGTYVSGTFTNVQGVIRNNREDRDAKLYAFGWNNQYKGDDGWNATFDLSYSKTKRNETIFETYSGTGYGRALGATDTIGFVSSTKGTVFSPTLNYSDPNLIQLTDPLGWGGSNVQAGYFNDRAVSDRIWQYRAEVEKEIEDSFFSSVQAGVNYTNHDKSLTPNEALVQLASGNVIEPVPSQYLKTPSDQTYLGLGPVISYNPYDLLDGGVYRLVSNNANNDVRAKAYSISEDLMTMYLQTNIRQDIGSAQLTGNIGVQAVNTSQHTSGYYIDPTNTGIVPIRQGADYWDVMPSLNLSLRTANDFVIRAALARQVMRPRMDSMRLGLSYGVDQTRGIIAGSSGNPFLRPFRANAADLTFEKYFGNKGYLAAQFFYKKLINYVVDRNLQDQVYDYTGLPLSASGGFQTTNPNAPNYVSPIGVITQPYNVKGGQLYGVELAGTLPLGEVVGFLNGFGVTGGGSYTKSEIVAYPGATAADLPGYSRWVANGTAYFEKWGFSARGSVRYRSSFIGEVSGLAANRVNRNARGELIVDGQIGYDFSNGFLQGLSVYLQGQNLTNTPFVTQNPGQDLQIIDYQRYGRRYLAGFTMKF
ncbi:TonB-dependent receptor [Sphingomonas sp. S-NIH.Pt15_0812]|uniref:TonB-dependent receptor n=1 Tax=Sphingomonas sp. S-NIH.Pt15_0812 TaxID=1920129 RepID=UPI000F7E0E26|nr:TonB-dependent receptor [Sphingomonas sp. S-NIH.Pt15_0812]RSU51724.1 TonB-dependent receptor [Sphingomonas sp. S-NIH.Pt15_0812]